MPQSVHRDNLFNLCLFERRCQSAAAYSGPVAGFAKLVAEHQIEPALRTFLFPFPECGYEFSRDGNFPYPLLCFGVEPAVFLLAGFTFTRAIGTVRRKATVLWSSFTWHELDRENVIG